MNIEMKTSHRTVRERQLHRRQRYLGKHQRHCEEVHVDPEETAEEQKKIIIKFKYEETDILQTRDELQRLLVSFHVCQHWFR